MDEPSALIADAVPFHPKPADLRLLDALRVALIEGGRTSLRALAERLGCSHQALSSRLRRRPQVGAWLLSELRRDRDFKWELLCERMYAIAIRDGSVPHATWIARVEGRFKQQAAPQSDAPQITVQIAGFTLPGLPIARTTQPAIHVTASGKQEDTAQ